MIHSDFVIFGSTGLIASQRRIFPISLMSNDVKMSKIEEIKTFTILKFFFPYPDTCITNFK